MKNVHVNFGASISRRTLLKSGSIALGIPMLDAMVPAFAKGPVQQTKRFVGVSLYLGLHGPNVVPQGAGTTYKPSPYLKSLQDIRDRYTIVSGSSHPGVSGGHTAEGSIWSACPNSRNGTSRNTISLDQMMARHLGHETRFPSLVLNTGSENSPSYTENGAMIPAEDNPVKVFTRLFVNDSKAEQERQAELLRRGRSVMDVIGGEAKALGRELGPGDRDKLDAWFTSVRELEVRLQANEAWVRKPKPTVDVKPPRDTTKNNAIEVERAMLDIVHLALQTDSTRFITLHLTDNRVTDLAGVDESYHGLSHHGRDEAKLAQLAIVEQAIVNEWANLLRKLKASDQGGHSLLDETMVMLTSNLGNASSHDNKNLPVLFGGGGFKHGRHLAFDQKKNYALPNLYLSALHQLGLQEERFATSTGTMDGLV
ncbi:MAG: hypothetical protein ACI9TH_003886 [Kiritimatiellia bacterium]|jgi:hypothetical protein